MESQQSHDIKAELESGLAMHTGSTRWFRHWTRRLVYTEGVQYLAEKASAYWLIDLVASWCPHPSLRNEEFVRLEADGQAGSHRGRDRRRRQRARTRPPGHPLDRFSAG